MTGLPNIPEASPTFEWGKYKKYLPYGKAEPTQVLETDFTPTNVAARSPWRVIPPDGLRWVAAGMWLLVTAGMLMFASKRIETDPAAPGHKDAPAEAATA